MMVTNQSQQVKAEGDINTSKEKLQDAQLQLRTIPQLLEELIDLAAKIARTDQMIAEVQAQAPQDPGAEKWHEVSKQALAFSRQALNARQLEILENLKSSTNAVAPSTIVNVKPDLVEVKDKEASTPTTPSTKCSTPTLTPAYPPGLDCQTTSGGTSKEPGLCKMVQDLRDQYGVRSMRKEIETLKQYPDRRVLIVRKIKALGFESCEVLKSYFGQFGAVEEVIVPHSFTKPGPQRKLGRIRPGVMGFVVMETTDGAEAAIGQGEYQMIQNPKGEAVTSQIAWFKESYNCDEAEE
jgi:hypothetical protein